MALESVGESVIVLDTSESGEEGCSSGDCVVLEQSEEQGGGSPLRVPPLWEEEVRQLPACTSWEDFLLGMDSLVLASSQVGEDLPLVSGLQEDVSCSQEVKTSAGDVGVAVASEGSSRKRQAEWPAEAQSSRPGRGEDISLRNQLAMSSEEEDNPTGERGGQYWLRLATAGGEDSMGRGEGEERGKGEVERDKRETSRDSDELVLDCGGEQFSEEEEPGVETPIVALKKYDVKYEELEGEKLEDEEVKDSGLDVFSLGNYCRAISSGSLCPKRRCGWVHYLAPTDAVTQFYRILANKPQDQVLKFAWFCLNPEVQERLEEEYRELVGEQAGEECWVDSGQAVHSHLEVCRAVFQAVLAEELQLPLGEDHLSELVELSTDIFPALDLGHTKKVLVPLLERAAPVLKSSEEGRQLLVSWAWDQLYLPHLSQGSLLPQQFHSTLSSLLAVSLQTLPQLAELLLYCSLAPSLQPCLASLHTLLTSTSALRADTALLTAKCLANLRDDDWRALQLAEVLPGLSLLADCLRDEAPEDVAKFYSALPEVEGLEVPSVPAYSSPRGLWIQRCLESRSWAALPQHLLTIPHSDLEELADFMENLVEEVERAAESGRLSISLPALLQVFLACGEKRGVPCSTLHQLLLRQIGLAFLVLLCRAMAWQEAATVVTLLAAANTNFTSTKLPAIGIFLDLNQVYTKV